MGTGWRGKKQLPIYCTCPRHRRQIVRFRSPRFELPPKNIGLEAEVPQRLTTKARLGAAAHFSKRQIARLVSIGNLLVAERLL